VGTNAGLTDKFYCGGETRKDYILETLGNGVALLDFDQDGDQDVFFLTGSRLERWADGNPPTNRLYRNEGNGKFVDVTQGAGLNRSGWGQGACVGDYDNDGWDDLFVTYFGSSVLYRNREGRRFEEVTEKAGLLARSPRWATGCAFVDYDRDGRLDLFIANYVDFQIAETPKPGDGKYCQWRGIPVMCGPRGLKGGVNQLFHNEGGGRFRDVYLASRISDPGERYSLSVTTLDYDRDGWPDMYVAVDSQPSLLFHNLKDGSFQETGLAAGAAVREDGREQAGMGSAAGDFDGDGYQDLLKTNFISDVPNLYRNNRDGTFSDWVYSAGLGIHKKYLGWGAAFFDYDNDALLDVVMVNGHVYPEVESKFPEESYKQSRLLFRNVGNARFADVSLQAGSALAERHASRGLAIGDFDNDGDLDLFITNMNAAPSLLRNDGGNASNFISLRLVGTRSNRNGIGAVVKVTAGGHVQSAEVRSGSSFMSQSDLRLHFGLRRWTQADTIEIAWPSGLAETLHNLPANHFVTVIEGQGVTGNRPRAAQPVPPASSGVASP